MRALAAGVAALALLAGPGPAAAGAEVIPSELLAATALRLTSDEAERVPAAVLAYRTDAGAVHVEVTICPAIGTCDTVAGEPEGATLTTQPLQRLHLLADLPGIGEVDLVFGAWAWEGLNYECIDSQSATFAVQGVEVVNPSNVSGTVGPWAVHNRVCGVWASDAVIEWVHL